MTMRMGVRRAVVRVIVDMELSGRRSDLRVAQIRREGVEQSEKAQSDSGRNRHERNSHKESLALGIAEATLPQRLASAH